MGFLELSRGGVDVGILTGRAQPMLDFWTGDLALPHENTIETMPGVTQHRLTLGTAVLKLNCLAPESFSAAAQLTGVRLLALTTATATEPAHRRDPDGNLLYVQPPTETDEPQFGVHLAVTDPAAARRFWWGTMGFDAVDENSCDIEGARLSWAWSPDANPAGTAVAAGYTYVTIQVMDVVAAHRQCCERGAAEIAPPTAAAFGTSSSVSFIADPDGNRIELSQRPDLVQAVRGNP